MPDKNNTARLDLAELLAAVFTHPDLPRPMWEVIADCLCELDSGFEKYGNADVMCEILAGYERRRAAERKERRNANG